MENIEAQPLDEKEKIYYFIDMAILYHKTKKRILDKQEVREICAGFLLIKRKTLNRLYLPWQIGTIPMRTPIQWQISYLKHCGIQLNNFFKRNN